MKLFVKTFILTLAVICALAAWQMKNKPVKQYITVDPSHNIYY